MIYFNISKSLQKWKNNIAANTLSKISIWAYKLLFVADINIEGWLLFLS